MAIPGMGWLTDLLGWDEEEQAAPPQDIEAVRAQQYARQWRQAVAPTAAPTVGPQPQSDPLQNALNQWRASSAPTATAPMQGPLRPGETRPMVPSVGPAIRPPTAPTDIVQQPAPNPWMAAVDAWRQGPPQQQPSQAPKPTDISSLITYDVKPTLPTISTGFESPSAPASFTAQQMQASTLSSNQPMQGPQPYNPSDWLSRSIGNWQKPIMEAGAALDQGITDYGRAVGEVGPIDATLGLLEGTPGYDKLVLGAKERAETGSNQGWDRFKDDFRNSMDAANAITGLPIMTQPIWGTGKVVGGQNVSAGQLASAAGEMLNRTINPFNPNQIEVNPLNPGPQLANLFWNNLRQSQAVRSTIEALPEEMRTQANAAMVNLISGPDAVKDAADAVMNQDSMVADLEQKAQQAQAAGDAQAAAQYGAQAWQLKNKTKTELIDEQANAWAEFMGGVFLDPTNFITFGGQEAIQAAKSSALMNLSPEDALKALDGVMDNVAKAATGGNVAGWWNAVNPFARTADTKAAMSTDTLWRAAANIMADVTNKEQAKAVLDMWTSDPRQLVEGVVLPGSTEISKWGGGVVANQELLQQYPLLVKARESLLNMRSLAGDPATFSPTEFFAELNDVLYKQSRELYGLKTLDELPAGAVNFRTVKTANGTNVIEYVDKQGKVLKKSAEMLPYDAELYGKQLKNAIKSAGPGGQNPLAATWGVQKAILSDMYLGMSPGYWIKNATSAAATLLTDNTMTLLPTNTILNDLMTKFGGVLPTTRSAEAGASALGQAAKEALGGMHWSEKLFGKDNPYAKLMNRLYAIPFGATDIGGNIPFGEQNFALRATYVPFKRYLTSQWGDAAKGFEQTLTTLGIDPNLAKSLANTVADVGVNGNKAQMQAAMKKLTTAQVVPFSLKELGVPDELVSAEGWAKLNTLLSESLPNQLDEAAAKVKEIFGQEFKAAGQLLNSAPPQPGRYVWTEFESVQDGADVVDGLVDAAKRAGLPVDQMRQEAQGLMKTIADTERALWTTLRQDLAGATDAGSLNVAMDLMAKWYDWRQAARAQVDGLSKAAIQTNTTEAWAKKFEGTRQIYGQFPEWFQGAVDEARQNLIKLEQGGQVEGGYDWWNVIKRYASYDEAEVRTARTAGLGVGSPQGQGDVFAKALDANRKYVDKSVIELYSAFRQYPSQTTLDLVADGMRKMEELGAKAAGFLADKRTTMLPKNADAYYKLRNQVWAEFFDNAVVHNNVVKRLVVASGVADMAKGALKWTDEFAGGEFQLVGKLADGFWQARNTATGELVRFADPVNLQQMKNASQVVVSSLPTVPLKTIQDFYRVIGENTNIIDKLIDELDAQSAAAVAKREAQLEAELARLMAEEPTVPTMRLVAPADQVAAMERATAEQAAMQADQAKEIAAGSKEARQALAAEWDRIAKAAGGFPKLDQLIATYTREGIVNVPENLFEDLYGQTIAGRRLNSQADVEKFLQEYYDLGQQAKNAPAIMERAAAAPITPVAQPAVQLPKPDAQSLRMTKAQAQPLLQQAAKNLGIPPEQVLAQAKANFIEAVQNQPIELAIDPEKLDDVIQSGVRNGFQITSDVSQQALADYTIQQWQWGIPTESPAEARPIFAFVANDEMAQDQAGLYGSVRLRLKDGVKERLTYAAGDTGNAWQDDGFVILPSADLNNIDETFFGPYLEQWANKPNIKDFYADSGIPYVEVQVYGGIRAEDIEAVFPDYNEYTGRLSEVAQKYFDERGIPVQSYSSYNPKPVTGVDDPEVDKAMMKFFKFKDTENFTPTPNESDFGMGVGQVFGQLLTALQTKRANPYTLPPNASGWNPWGIAENIKQTDLYKLVSGINGNLAGLFGKKAPEVGEVAQHTIRTLAEAERKILQRLPEILAGKPNTMTPAQQLRVLDALQEILPQYDNVLAGAVRTGEQMANYAMLNYNDKRNIDVWAASLMPYHYFWSRSAKNWMQRAVQKPGIVNMWYESQRAIAMENEQNNVPEHLRGTIQNPFGVGPDRLLNPLNFMLPFAMYLGSDFVNPDEAKSEFERWKLTVQKYTPAMFPLADYATKAILDQTNPLPGGKKRTDDFQLGDVLPLYKMAGYAYQGMTGQMGPQGILGYGDEYDYGRAGKQVALAGLRGDVSPQDAMWASDVGYQQQTGAQPLPEQQGQGVDAWQQGVQAAGWDRFANRAMAFLTGVPGYNLSEEEKQMRAMKEQRVQLGYNEVTNPWGSKEAVNAYTNMQPDQFDATFNYAALYPQGDDRKRQRPGEGAVQTEYYQQHGVIMNDMMQAVAKYLIENPNATSKELNDFKAPYWDKVNALKEQYPSLPAKEVKHLNTKYMNPVEHGAAFVQSILSHKPAGQPTYPGKDASPEAKKEYYLAKAKWDTARLDYYDRQFTQLLNQDDTYPDPWKEAARKMVKDMYSSELLRGYENRYAGDVEKAWSDRQSFVEEVQDAERALNSQNVIERVGQQGADLLSQYYALPKGSEERKQFKQENPLVQAAIMASYQPQEYDAFIQKFGPDAFTMIANAPKHPGDGASEAQLQQYYAQLDAYSQQYPNAEAAKLWMNGRRFGAAEGSDSYGAAYDEAIKIFGPNIFDILNNVPQGKDAFVAWMKSNPEEYMLYTGYKEWKKEYSDQDKATVDTQTTPEEEAIIPNANAGQGYTGPRPVGSERQPLGQFDPYATTPAQQVPNAWTARNWNELLQKPADNPWTQRANELNAALLGDQPIPSTMAANPTAQAGGPMLPDWAGNDKPAGSADLKTAREYASMSEKWVKGEMTRQEWAARRSSVTGYFGAGGAKMFDEYYNLPKGAAREEYLKANPVMRAINLYAYNQKELQPALKEFGDDALGLWALTPAYADTPEAKAARNAYYDKNPKAFLFSSWLNGRPANYDESKEGATDFKYNFGADYNQAKELFGENIWEIVGQFKRGWSAQQRRAFYEKNPQYNEWANWWYGREKKEYGQGGGGRSYGGGGFGGYSRQEPAKRPLVVQQPNVYAQGMSGGLGEPARISGYNDPQINLNWMRAGQELKPGRQVKEWSPEWIRGIKKQ